MRKQVPITITLIVGIVMILSYFLPPISKFNETFQQWFIVISAAVMILGIINLISVNWAKIKHKRENWQYSIVLVAGFAMVTIFGFWNVFVWIFTKLGIDLGPYWMLQGKASPLDQGTPLNYVFNYVHVPMSSTMFSLLAFYVASAAYRAFRARSLEATLLLIAAFIVMLGRVPIGDAISHWIPSVAEWIMDIPNTAGQRAIKIGIALGIVSTSLRIIFGIERSYLSDGGD